MLLVLPISLSDVIIEVTPRRNEMTSTKTKYKLILDLIMFTGMMLMYSKNAVSLEFHEIVGLIVLGIMLVHLLINGDWVKAVSKQLFDKNIPAKSKLSWVVDFLLLMCTIVMIVTSLLISKKLFPAIGNHAALNPIHFCAAVMFLVLVGIHVGLHFRFIGNSIAGAGHIPSVPLRAVMIVAAMAFAGYGVYNLATSEAGRWVEAPFNGKMAAQHHAMMEQAMKTRQTSDDKQSEVTVIPAGEANQAEMRGNGHQQQPVTVGSVVMLFVRFSSIAWLFALCVFGIEEMIRQRRKTVK